MEDKKIQKETWVKYITEEIRQEAIMTEMNKNKRKAKDKFQEKWMTNGEIVETRRNEKGKEKVTIKIRR